MAGVTGIAAANYHSLAISRGNGAGHHANAHATIVHGLPHLRRPLPQLRPLLSRLLDSHSHKPFDLFVRSANGNIVLVTTSAATPNPGPANIRHDLPAFVKSLGTPRGAPTYTTDRRSGTPFYVGLSAYRTAQGQVGVAIVEEAYGHHRLCVAAGVIRDATSPTAKADLTAAVTVLSSLTLSPPSHAGA